MADRDGDDITKLSMEEKVHLTERSRIAFE
jgi:hypothetical protein